MSTSGTAGPGGRPVAVAAAAPPDEHVPGHYGDPYGEQRRLEVAAVVDRSHRGVVVVEGPDRLSWLHALGTQHVAALAPGVPTELLVLSPHGHVEHQVDLVDDGTRSWLLVEPGAAPPLASWLDSMRFMTRVEVRDETASWATLTVTGPVPPELQAAAAMVRRRRWPEGAADVLVARAAAPALLAGSQAGAELPAPAGHDAWEALRIAAGEARSGLDTDHKTLVHEVGWVASAVHLDKGCYRGQEAVARVHNLGRPPRRLVLLHLDGSEHLLPERGAELLTTDGTRVGALTSVARHHELGPIALAIVRRSVPDGAVLTARIDGGSVEGDRGPDVVVSAVIDRGLSSPTEPVDLSALR